MVCVWGGGLFSSYSEVAARFGEVLISAFNFFVQRPSDWDAQWQRKQSQRVGSAGAK